MITAITYYTYLGSHENAAVHYCLPPLKVSLLPSGDGRQPILQHTSQIWCECLAASDLECRAQNRVMCKTINAAYQHIRCFKGLAFIKAQLLLVVYIFLSHRRHEAGSCWLLWTPASPCSTCSLASNPRSYRFPKCQKEVQRLTMMVHDSGCVVPAHESLTRKMVFTKSHVSPL
jgi:hypothetical protein